MQTFVTHTGKDFSLTAKCLDYRRLGKQRVETKQIFQVLSGTTSAWKNHPIVKMWDGYEIALLEYGIAICNQWIARGYKDTLKEFFMVFYESLKTDNLVKYPPWLDNIELINSHRSCLLYKDYDFYSKYGWSVKPAIPDSKGRLPYIWIV